MKRFRWNLQRLLDVAEQRELALRSELFALSERAAETRGEMLEVRNTIGRMLSDLAEADGASRLARTGLVLDAAARQERRIADLDEALQKIRRERKAVSEKLLEARRRREGLERLREQAMRRWRTERDRREQSRLDEAATVGFNRRTRPTGATEMTQAGTTG